ncbi:hypothetical protein SmJEL517_g02989 [Synchytrium microbalum]|uniref:Helicase ATP-binding domain-containing protein n=1 Tax=Synchytrium microbalum TaxID=1806994 RepID=A0A507C5D3_9FUNG|nr:uncharacterized protein SmJEL517_g02989 [Synchytrium microbalum]TPX34329.1 hypothetical protein SmJEL517_g02989 [Synchytrium microbalum]
MDIDDLFANFGDSAPKASKPSNGASGPATTNTNGKKRAANDEAPTSKKLRNDKAAKDDAPVKTIRILEANQPVPLVADEFAQEFSKEYTVRDSDATVPNATTPNAASSSSLNEPQATLKISGQVRHQVALPPDWPNYIPLHEHVNDPSPARTYPFQLDPFQQLSVKSIERNESVLVSAHTSAGKTVVAEYAIAQGLRNKTRVIYTSPIKALSNQKYRELLEAFGDVGLMTGDVTINPTASCIVMTTEILRSMLYRGSDISREVSWVIFDEIHYMRDKSRGVVWEETIIMLPDQVRFVFLSATIPNAMQFAQWICRIHKQPCHVVYTDYRPTPLQHYIFPEGSSGIHLVVDEKGEFKEQVFQRAISSLTSDEEKKSKKMNKKGKKDISTQGKGKN